MSKIGDIFFVISGYLISNVILSELNEDKFSFESFYLRRIKRIFPGLFFVLTLTFGRNWKLGLLTTFPVVWVISLEPLTFVALGQPLSLVTVMIGSIVIGVGIDFSIHITQRVIEGGMNMPSVYNAIAKTAQTLAEATLVTLVGLTAAFAIKISALWWFVFIIVVLLIASMISAMFLLPALYSLIIKSGGTLS